MIHAQRAAGRTVGLVPTMGALHPGHLSLVRAACGECDYVAVTIFVNPAQFGEARDLQNYPRNLDQDLTALESLPVDLVFAPSAEDIYPTDFTTYVEPPAVAKRLEGDYRTGHFRGVATVVLKLFHLLPADVAYFGQKDYQQSLVVRHMVRDLDLPMEIRVCPIVRDADGLALSSRNARLSPEQRQRALGLSACLQEATMQIHCGERNANTIKRAMLHTLQEAGVDRIDYVAIADPGTLAELEEVNGPAVALVAAHVGETRLIDNCRIVPS